MADLNVIESSFKEDNDDSSPECLLLPEPVKDQYDSDCSQEPQPKDKRGCIGNMPCKKRRRLAPITEDTSLLLVIDSFHINFLNNGKNPTSYELKNMDMEGVLTSLLTFLSGEPISAKDAIKEVLHLPNILPKNYYGLKFLLHYNSYQFPENYDGCLGDDELYDKFFVNAKHDVKELTDRITEFNTLVPFDKEHQKDLSSCDKCIQHAIVKYFFSKFCECFSSQVKFNGETHIQLQLMRTEGVHATHRVAIHNDYVENKPDFVIRRNDYSLPPVPFEVFSPLNWKKRKQDSSHQYESMPEDSDSDTSDKGEPKSTKECKDYSKVLEFMKENMPSEFLDDLPTGSSSDFQKKCMQQLLINLVGCTKNVFVEPNNNIMSTGGSYTAIGMFAFHFNLYIVKLEGCKKDFWGLFTHDPNWHKRLGKCFNVSIFPVPLDCTKPSIGIAVMIFLKYYREVFKSSIA